LPGIVPIDTLLLGRTDQVAVAVTGLSAFSAGIEIFLTARIRPSGGHPGEHLPGGPRDLAASRRSFRFGLQFSDGRKAAGSESSPLAAAHRNRATGRSGHASAGCSEPRSATARAAGRRSEARRSSPGPRLVGLSRCGRRTHYRRISRMLPIAD
jgi:hypothetical protein